MPRRPFAAIEALARLPAPLVLAAGLSAAWSLFAATSPPRDAAEQERRARRPIAGLTAERLRPHWGDDAVVYTIEGGGKIPHRWADLKARGPSSLGARVAGH